MLPIGGKRPGALGAGEGVGVVGVAVPAAYSNLNLTDEGTDNRAAAGERPQPDAWPTCRNWASRLMACSLYESRSATPRTSCGCLNV